MGTLALQTETERLETYVALGLKESGKQKPGYPRVLSLVSLFLERCVQRNEILLEKRQIKDIITIFHGSSAPSLGIQQYINRIFKYSCCSPSCFVVAHIYIDRFVQNTKIHLSSLNVHRLLITSVMVAAKFNDDAFFNNAFYAKVGGVSTGELNRLEMKFLFALDFQLNVSVQSFYKNCLELAKEGSEGGRQIERPIMACGIKESWSNKDDTACPSTIAR